MDSTVKVDLDLSRLALEGEMLCGEDSDGNRVWLNLRNVSTARCKKTDPMNPEDRIEIIFDMSGGTTIRMSGIDKFTSAKILETMSSMKR